ncbi:uncharacterized protein LOC110442507 [Mizuhopecten yessoensis]|uniref:Cysteine and tyrosine-rich protein 1 n=1 Tax=Mizuhopecten yessoensis TaxID=6573 RepID=A0A210PH30_MIZYE|nr:uncharacterized protein LOC110442507 [Mizuhopecten yessoensis]OWF35795.1 hypothetical protein KP79_PYT11493 [Mizuhopecten yessoensis]
MEVVIVVFFLVLLQAEVTDGECEACPYGCCTSAQGDEECCTAIVPVLGIIAAVTSCGVVIAIVVIVCCCRRKKPDASKKGPRPSPVDQTSNRAPNTTNGTDVAGQRYPLMPLRCPECEDRYIRSQPWTDIDSGCEGWPLGRGVVPDHTLIPTPMGSTYSIRTSTIVDLPSYQHNFSVF